MGGFFFCMFSVLETESTGSYTLGRCSATEVFLHSCGVGSVPQWSAYLCLGSVCYHAQHLKVSLGIELRPLGFGNIYFPDWAVVPACEDAFLAKRKRLNSEDSHSGQRAATQSAKKNSKVALYWALPAAQGDQIVVFWKETKSVHKYSVSLSLPTPLAEDNSSPWLPPMWGSS